MAMAFSIVAGSCSPHAARRSCSTWSFQKAMSNQRSCGYHLSVRSNNYNWISRYPNYVLGGNSSVVGRKYSATKAAASSPWLMLPPVFEGGNNNNNKKKNNMVYQFYSLAENKVVSFNGGEEREEECAKIVGSSRGWLALFHQHNCDLFLYDPLSRRLIKLPPIRNLPNIPDVNLRMGSGCLSTVIISSSSPDEEDCRAMIAYGPEHRLAFCCPGRSTDWTPLGDSYQYESLAYSSTQKLFFCATPRHTDFLEAWDLRDPVSPRMTPIVVSVDELDNNCALAPCSELELDLKRLCDLEYEFLVVAEQSDQLLHVTQFVLHRIGPDASFIDDVWYGSSKGGYDHSVPYRTVGFDVRKYDPETGSLEYMDRTLGGLALFIGPSDGFALSAAEFPELKPNSIYYTDSAAPLEWSDRGYGGHDVGIFNYEDATFSSCYYPCDFKSIIKSIVPTPRWFAPNHSSASTSHYNWKSVGQVSSLMSTISDDDQSFLWPPKASPWLSKTSPWLMLPPIIEGGDNNNMVYQFYSLGENRVLGLQKRSGGDFISSSTVERKEEESVWAVPDDNSKIAGSSHGWLVLVDEHNCHLFLSNPLTRRHIKLPPMDCIANLAISSSSPDEEDCRAMIIYSRQNRLAFCCPGRTSNTEWTPLGDLNGYVSCVYSTTQKLFFCCKKRRYGDGDHLEAWDLRDPHSPKMIPMPIDSVGVDNYPVAARSMEELDRKETCDSYEFLVVMEPSDQLFLVRRFVEHWMGPHGYYVHDAYYGPKMGFDDTTPYKTVGFDVYKYDRESGSLRYMDGSLDGLALFIGSNNGFTLSPAEFPELKPNSIYYTAPPRWSECCGGHDVGIFDYQDQTFSPCFYPPDVQSMHRINPPIWFTPTPLVRFPFLVKNHDDSLSYHDLR